MSHPNPVFRQKMMQGEIAGNPLVSYARVVVTGNSMLTLALED